MAGVRHQGHLADAVLLQQLVDPVRPGGGGLGRLPGDIVIERENFRFYFPITTMVLISLVLSLVFWLFRK